MKYKFFTFCSLIVLLYFAPIIILANNYTNSDISSTEDYLSITTVGRAPDETITGTTTAMGGAISFLIEGSTTTLESITFEQVGSLNYEFIDSFKLYYDLTGDTTATCETSLSNEDVENYEQYGSTKNFNSTSTTFSETLTIPNNNRVCFYGTYSIPLSGPSDAPSIYDIGKTIRLQVTDASFIELSEEYNTKISMRTPLSFPNATTLSQTGVNTLTLNMVDNTQTVFYLKDNSIYKQEGVTATKNPDAKRVTPLSVNILNAIFTNYTDDNGQQLVRIEILIEDANPTYSGEPIQQWFRTTAYVGS